MSTETEKKLGSLLKTTQESGSSNASTSAFNDQQDRTAALGLKRPDLASKLSDSPEKEKFSVALKERQEKLKVHMAKANCSIMGYVDSGHNINL